MVICYSNNKKPTQMSFLLIFVISRPYSSTLLKTPSSFEVCAIRLNHLPLLLIAVICQPSHYSISFIKISDLFSLSFHHIFIILYADICIRIHMMHLIHLPLGHCNFLTCLHSKIFSSASSISNLRVIL